MEIISNVDTLDIGNAFGLTSDRANELRLMLQGAFEDSKKEMLGMIKFNIFGVVVKMQPLLKTQMECNYIIFLTGLKYGEMKHAASGMAGGSQIVDFMKNIFR